MVVRLGLPYSSFASIISVCTVNWFEYVCGYTLYMSVGLILPMMRLLAKELCVCGDDNGILPMFI